MSVCLTFESQRYYLGTEFRGAVSKPRNGREFEFYVSTFSVKHEKWSFHVADLPRTRKKCIEIEKSTCKSCFLVIKYAKFVALSLPSRRRSLTPCSQNADALWWVQVHFRIRKIRWKQRFLKTFSKGDLLSKRLTCWLSLSYKRGKRALTKAMITINIQALWTLPSAFGVGLAIVTQLNSSSYSFHPGVAMLISTPLGSSTAHRVLFPTLPNGRVKERSRLFK